MIIKKVLATMLAATLLAMPIVAGATDQATPAPAQTPATTTTETAAPQQELVTKAAPVTVGGTVIKSDVAGAFAIPATAPVSGVALRKANDTIKAENGLAKNEKAFLTAYELTAKGSPLVYASFQAAAASVGGTVIDGLNIDFGKMTGGKFTDLPATYSAPVTVGVKNPGGKTLAAVKVVPGGESTVYQDMDENPNTITFPISGGSAGYAVIAY